MPGSPKLSLSFRFPHQNPVYASPLPHTRQMPRPSYSSRFYTLYSYPQYLQAVTPLAPGGGRHLRNLYIHQKYGEHEQAISSPVSSDTGQWGPLYRVYCRATIDTLLYNLLCYFPQATAI
jgi:hypothetical protein